MAVLDFFKKKPSVSDATPPAGDASQVPSQAPNPTVVQQSETVTTAPVQSYNGIGNPPGGQAYNGIGTPPAPVNAQNVGPDQTGQAQIPAVAPIPVDPNTTQDVQKTDGTAQTPATPDGITPAQPGTPGTPPADGATPPAEGVDKQANLDLMTHLTQRSNRVFVSAQQKAQELKSEYVDSEHLLHGLLADPEIYKLFTDNKVPPQIIDQELDKIYKKGNAQKAQLAPRVKTILDNGLVIARKLGYEFISPEHILLALYEEGEGLGARTLAKLGIKKEQLNKKITGKKEGMEGVDKEKASSSQSALAEYTTDLTEKAAQGLLDKVVERSEVIERAIHIISRRTKNNPALVGEAGVGKTAIVEGLAQKIANKEVPESLLGKKILQLDLMRVIAGASHRGEFEERMKKLIEEIVASKGGIILFIDEIHNLVGAGAGGEGSLDASNFLKPSLARGELQVIGATTLTEYRRYIEKDPALERRFQPVLVPEPTPEQAIKMLKATRDKYEGFHKVKIPDEAIEVAVKLSKRYVGDRFLPDKAVDLIDEAAAAVRLPLMSLPEEIRSLEDRVSQLKQELEEAEKSGNRVKAGILKPKIEDISVEIQGKQDEYNIKKAQTTTSVSEQSIKDIIARWTGIPISKITESETEKLKNLENIIHERLINQDNAVQPISQAIRRGRAGLKSNERPIGSFVFLGPTGVGKTELAKTLAEVLFGQEESMIRFDMTEYMEKHEVAKLLGAPPGYVGYEEGGKLTEAVRRKPYSVVLFDEVEKAHPDIFNILLQILDDGRLTDNKGHVISFKNTVVITTSNIGTKMIQDEIMASGKVDIEEPTLISTFTFSPRGRQLMTIMGKVFERESDQAQWQNKMLLDYFAGQKIEAGSAQPAKSADAPSENTDGTTTPSTPAQSQDMPDFPAKQFDTHAISPKGVEMITADSIIYSKNATTAKVWDTKSLIDYFKDHVVINALPDAPEQQLPTDRLKTHAFSPAEMEIVTYRDRYWKRKDGDTNWETGTLKDYFEGQKLMSDTSASSKIQTPSSNDGKTPNSNIQIPNEKADTGTSDAMTAKPAEAKIDVKDTKPDTNSTKDTEPIAFPVNYWDIHTFSPDGKEMIIVGDRVWIKDSQTTNWSSQLLHDYFGKDFPLDQELDEKQKVEDELAKNQYERIKGKVMEELRKFFRPELINRFDEVIIFEPLKYQHMLQIAELQLKALRKMLEEQSIGFAWTKPSVKEIVRQGFDPLYGARPLKRTIQKLIENPISELIIDQKLKESDLMNVDFDGDNFIFNIEQVKFVTEAELSHKKLRKFRCVQSQHSFETEVADNCTIFCPLNAEEPVEEIMDLGTQNKEIPNSNIQIPNEKDEKNPSGNNVDIDMKTDTKPDESISAEDLKLVQEATGAKPQAPVPADTLGSKINDVPSVATPDMNMLKDIPVGPDLSKNGQNISDAQMPTQHA